VLVLNNPSLEKYEPLVQPGGVLVYNSSLIAPASRRADIHYVAVPASDIAAELGDIKVTNMAALGALVAATHVVPLAAVKQALPQHLPQSKRELLAANEQALQRGAQCAEPGQYQ
jgi:2-oxoglutarate ferredoxin oxidoreductase subunit gamma